MLPEYVGRHGRPVAALSEVRRRYLATEPGVGFEATDTLLAPAVIATTFDGPPLHEAESIVQLLRAELGR